MDKAGERLSKDVSAGDELQSDAMGALEHDSMTPSMTPWVTAQMVLLFLFLFSHALEI